MADLWTEKKFEAMLRLVSNGAKRLAKIELADDAQEQTLLEALDGHPELSACPSRCLFPKLQQANRDEGTKRPRPCNQHSDGPTPAGASSQAAEICDNNAGRLEGSVKGCGGSAETRKKRPRSPDRLRAVRGFHVLRRSDDRAVQMVAGTAPIGFDDLGDLYGYFHPWKSQVQVRSPHHTLHAVNWLLCQEEAPSALNKHAPPPVGKDTPPPFDKGTHPRILRNAVHVCATRDVTASEANRRILEANGLLRTDATYRIEGSYQDASEIIVMRDVWTAAFRGQSLFAEAIDITHLKESDLRRRALQLTSAIQRFGPLPGDRRLACVAYSVSWLGRAVPHHRELVAATTLDALPILIILHYLLHQ